MKKEQRCCHCFRCEERSCLQKQRLPALQPEIIQLDIGDHGVVMTFLSIRVWVLRCTKMYSKCISVTLHINYILLTFYSYIFIHFWDLTWNYYGSAAGQLWWAKLQSKLSNISQLHFLLTVADQEAPRWEGVPKATVRQNLKPNGTVRVMFIGIIIVTTLYKSG